MKLPFILRLERKPRLRRRPDIYGSVVWECHGRGVVQYGYYDFEAWAQWFAAVFPGPHGVIVLQLAEEERAHRRQAGIDEFCGMPRDPVTSRRWEGDVKAIADAFEVSVAKGHRLVAETAHRMALDGMAAIRITATGDDIRMDLMDDFVRASLGPQK